MQSSALVLANGTDFCSDWPKMERTSCSHHVLLRLPSSGRARQRRITLTVRASDRPKGRMAPVLAGKVPHFLSSASAARWTQRRNRPASSFSKVVKCPASGIKAIKNSSEKRKRHGAWLGAARAEVAQKPWLKRRPWPSRTGQIPLAANVSTIARWRARPDHGEHSGTQCEHDEHDARAAGSQSEQRCAPFASTSADDCKRLHVPQQPHALGRSLQRTAAAGA